MPVAALVLRPDREFEKSGSHRLFPFLSLTLRPSSLLAELGTFDPAGQLDLPAVYVSYDKPEPTQHAAEFDGAFA